MARLTIILNRGAGTAAKGITADEITTVFTAHGVDVSVLTATGSNLVGTARRAIAGGATTLIAAGGDGTVSAVASVVAGTDVRMGVLPLGTLNHFARDLGLPTTLDGAVQAILTGTVAAVDVGEVNGHTFINNSSVGMYPRLVWERVQEQRRGRRKWHAFAVALLRVWRRFRRVRVTVRQDDDERVVHTPFVFVGNNEYRLEGVRMGARQRLDAGWLHVCMAPGLQRMDMLRILLAALVGRLRGFERFESMHAREFTIAAYRRRLGVSLDGEVVVLRTPLQYRLRPAALQVIVPRAAPAGGS